jgi:hypothetical protein
MIVFIMPNKAEGQRRNPYSYYSLRGHVDFNYAKQRYGTSDSMSETTDFRRIYSLSLRGNIWDPRFLIFDSSISLDGTDTNISGAKSFSKVWDYSLTTTFFPQFRFPLTLYGRLSRGENSYKGQTRDSTLNNYGLRWFLRFKVLPITRLGIDWRERDINNIQKSEEISYDLYLRKDIGPTKNNLFYELITKEDKLNNTDSASSSLTFANATNLGLKTFMSFAASRYKDNTPTSDTKSEASTVILKSNPSKRFRQYYAYTFVKSEDRTRDEANTMQYVSASLSYALTDRLKTAWNFALNTSESESPAVRSKTEGLSLGVSSGYKLTYNLSASGAINYSLSKREEGEPLTGKTERENRLLRLGLRYKKRMNWANFSSGYSLGYEEKSAKPEDDGKAIAHSFSTGLTNIDLRYLTLDTRYSLSISESYRYNIDQRSESYSIGARSNRLKYLTLSGVYKFYKLDSYEDRLDEERNRTRLEAKSTYIKNTRLQASTEYEDSKIPGLGVYSVLRTDFFGHHIRRFLNGQLNLSAGYTWARRDFEGGSGLSTSRRTIYGAKYRKNFSRRLNGAIGVKREKSVDNEIGTTTTSLDTRLKYILGSWHITAEYDRFILESSSWDESRIKDYFMVRLTRSFGLRFF